jgi:exodeoxyribonuclease VII large subunit
MTVNSLNIKIKSLLEATFMHIKVKGEIASVTYHQSSGHIYFSIKDEKSSIKCVMFRSNAQKLKFRLERGEKIVVDGSVGVYTPRGEYQFYAVDIEPYGVGGLALAYEQLKAKLKAKGYFDSSNKKPIPKNIRKIALVTAKNSAGLQDMLKIIDRRYRLVEVTIVDTLVQGRDAPKEIAQALYYADTLSVDVIIVGRGGGSVEDLWSFNEEIVADTIFSLYTPVVSAVGHQSDVLISDFVADLRAPTPSASIEMILPDSKEILYMLDELLDRYNHRLKEIIYHKQDESNKIQKSLDRFSLNSHFGQLSVTFEQIASEYQRVMRYKMIQFEASLPPLRSSLKYQVDMAINQKDSDHTNISKLYSSHNPKNSLKNGWAKLTKDAKSTNLKSILIGERFLLEDRDSSIEALCLDKRDI